MKASKLANHIVTKVEGNIIYFTDMAGFDEGSLGGLLCPDCPAKRVCGQLQKNMLNARVRFSIEQVDVVKNEGNCLH